MAAARRRDFERWHNWLLGGVMQKQKWHGAISCGKSAQAYLKSVSVAWRRQSVMMSGSGIAGRRRRAAYRGVKRYRMAK